MSEVYFSRPKVEADIWSSSEGNNQLRLAVVSTVVNTNNKAASFGVRWPFFITYMAFVSHAFKVMVELEKQEEKETQRMVLINRIDRIHEWQTYIYE